MHRAFIIGFLIVMALDTLAQVSFKMAGMDTHPTSDWLWIARVGSNKWTYGAIFGYAGSFITWMSLLKHVPVGPAFAATHLYVVSTAIVSCLLFGEKLSLIQTIGALFIVAGILVLAYGKEKDSNTEKVQTY
jgi:drug/metabolite transporter (DMT)-like permease